MDESLEPQSAMRRLAKERLPHAEAAQRLTRQLIRLCEMSGLEVPELNTAHEKISGHERTLIQLGTGRIEPRKKYPRTSSLSDIQSRPRMILYVDESGKPQASSGGDHFVLTGVAVSEDKVGTYETLAMSTKSRFFGDTSVIFHEPLMRQRADRFNLSNDSALHRQFDDEIRGILQNLEFTVFAVAVHKRAYHDQFLVSGADPYLPEATYSLAIEMLLERFVDFLAHRSEVRLGKVIFESIGSREDAEHQRDYAKLLLEGTRYVPDGAFRLWLESGCLFSPKQPNTPLEIADLVSREVFEYVRDGRSTSPKFWETIEPKIYCREDGLRGKFGLKLFPDIDRDVTIKHREKCLELKNEVGF